MAGTLTENYLATEYDTKPVQNQYDFARVDYYI